MLTNMPDLNALNSKLKDAILEKDETGRLKKNEEKILDILDEFIENKVVPNIDINNHPIIYPIITFFSDKILLRLLESGVDVNCTINSGELRTTPLHIAIYHKNINKVQQLINFNININAQDSMGDTALHLSIKSNELKIAEVLLERGIDQTIRNKDNNTAFDLKDDIKVKELFKEVENNQTAKGQTFSLSLKSSDAKIPSEDLKILLEGIMEKFIEEGKLDYINRTTAADEGKFKLKFIGKSSYENILELSAKYSKLLASQANEIYGTTNVELSFQDNANLAEKINIIDIQLGGEALYN